MYSTGIRFAAFLVLNFMNRKLPDIRGMLMNAMSQFVRRLPEKYSRLWLNSIHEV